MKKYLIAAAFATVLAGTASAQTVVLKAHSFSGPQAPEQSKNLVPWAEKVAKLSGGRLKIEIYPSMQLGGKPSDLPQQLEDGVVDIIMEIPGYAPGRFPGVEGLELPFTNVGTTTGESAAAFEWATRWLKDTDFKGFKVLSIHATDPSTFHTRDKEIKSIADLKNLKIRVPSKVVGGVVQKLGAVPVGIPLPDVYEALSRGQVDGMLINWIIMPPFRLNEVTKYHLDTPVYQTPIMMLMNQKSYDKLPPDLQKIIDETTGLEHSREVGEQLEKMKDAAIETIRKAGGVIDTLPAADVAKLKADVQPLHAAWIAEMNKRGMPGQKMYDDLLATTAKYGRK